MHITAVLLDLDNTILDFYAAEDAVLGKAFCAHGIAPTQDVLAQYHAINLAQWALLEQGRITIDEIGVRRFALLLAERGLSGDAAALAATYEAMLADVCFFMPGAQTLLETLSARYPLYLVTNGMASVQYGRIERAGIGRYFKKCFVSSDLGAVKPHAAFFEACFAQMDGAAPSQTVIVGDGLNSDIRGGIQAGLRTIWFNHRGFVNDTPWQPDAEIHGLDEVMPLLQRWAQDLK